MAMQTVALAGRSVTVLGKVGLSQATLAQVAPYWDCRQEGAQRGRPGEAAEGPGDALPPGGLLGGRPAARFPQPPAPSAAAGRSQWPARGHGARAHRPLSDKTQYKM